MASLSGLHLRTRLQGRRLRPRLRQIRCWFATWMGCSPTAASTTTRRGGWGSASMCAMAWRCGYCSGPASPWPCSAAAAGASSSSGPATSASTNAPRGAWLTSRRDWRNSSTSWDREHTAFLGDDLNYLAACRCAAYWWPPPRRLRRPAGIQGGPAGQPGASGGASAPWLTRRQRLRNLWATSPQRGTKLAICSE